MPAAGAGAVREFKGLAWLTRKKTGVDRDMAKRWYSVSVLSNFEKKVAEAIRQAVAEKGLEDQIDEVLVPTEEVIEIRRGKKVTSERRFMPGYVLVRMELSDKTYHLVNSINRVTGFLGAQGKPMPMRDDEVNAILQIRRKRQVLRKPVERDEVIHQILHQSPRLKWMERSLRAICGRSEREVRKRRHAC